MIFGYGRNAEQMQQQQNITMTFDDAITAAMDLLKGTLSNHIMCILAMMTSLAFTILGFVMMTDGHRSQCGMLIVTIFFLISAAVTSTKTSRDYHMASVALKNHQPSIEFNFLRPACLEVFQTSAFLVLAIAACVYSLTQVLVEEDSTGRQNSAEWFGFAALAMMWILDSVCALSRSVHDRRDTAAWAATEKESRVKQLKYVLAMCGGTLDYCIITWVAFFVASVTYLVWVWAGFSSAELSMERKGLLSITLLYNVASSFHVAKLVRDRQQAAKMKHMSTQSTSLQWPFQVMVVLNFLISIGVPVACIIGITTSTDQMFFLLTGFFMTMNTTLNLAKMQRDRHEMKLLKERMPQAGGVEHARDILHHPGQILQQAGPLAMLKGQSPPAGQDTHHHAMNIAQHMPGFHHQTPAAAAPAQAEGENPIWEGVQQGFEGLVGAAFGGGAQQARAAPGQRI